VASGVVNMVVPLFSSPAAQAEGWQEVLPSQQQQQQEQPDQQQGT
jgi:hypothetical protein